MKAKDILEDIENMDAMDIQREAGAIVGFGGFGGKGNMLDDVLSNNLWSIRGHRDLIQLNLPADVVPTTFDDIDDPPDEDEDGEDTPVLNNGYFVEQRFDVLRSKCHENGVLFFRSHLPAMQHVVVHQRRTSEPLFFRRGHVGSCQRDGQRSEVHRRH